MCEQLTSVALKVTEPYALGIHAINSHSKTWEALKLERPEDPGILKSPWREMEWLDGNNEPSIRWRDEDDKGTRAVVMDWVLENWRTRDAMIGHCLMNAQYVDASGCTTLTKLDAPVAKTVYASGCTTLTNLDAPKESVYR